MDNIILYLETMDNMNNFMEIYTAINFIKNKNKNNIDNFEKLYRKYYYKNKYKYDENYRENKKASSRQRYQKVNKNKNE